MIIREINIAQDHAIGEPVTMIDYGLKIKLTGMELPTAYEVHFSNSMNQPATVAIGDASGVVVPYEYTEMSGTLYGWLYLHNDMTDGYTARSFALKINRRATVDPPQALPPQATVIEQAIIALNMAIERTEAARDEAEESAGEAEQSAQQAAASAAGAAQSQSAAQSYAQQAQAAKTAAETSAGQAETSATAAANSASQASASQATASAAATRAENAMDAARTAAAEAAESAGLAQTAMEESATNAQNAADSATDAADSATNAATSATNASTSATAAATSATAAEAAQTAAESAATTATGKATETSESAADAAGSAADAEAAATRAEQTVTDSEAWALGAYATSSASGAAASVDDGAEDVPVKALTAYIVPVQEGTGDPSPDNVRPISGWAGLNLTRTGANAFEDSSAQWKNGYYLNAEGSETQSEYYRYTQAYFEVKSASDYEASYDKNSAILTALTVCMYRADKSFIQRELAIPSTTGTGTLTGTFATTAETKYIRFSVSAISAANIRIYRKNVYPVTWQDTAGTVYGSQYDAVTGVLTVTMAAVDMGTLTWTFDAGASWNCFSTLGLSLKKPGAFNLMCERYAVKVVYGTSDDNIVSGNVNNSTVTVRDTSYNGDAAAFKAAVTGQKLVYELATPITYQLSPLDVRTLRGVNNTFADTGDTDVTVRADPDLHLSKLIAQAVALSQNG